MTARIFAIVGLFVVLCVPAMAREKHHHGHHHSRSHGAHQHGVGELSLAFEGTSGKLELRAPSESFWGFEHEAKTAAQKKAVSEAKAKLERELAGMVKLDPSLNCVFQKGEIRESRERKNSGHSEIEVRSTVECEKSPLGSKLSMGFTGIFPKLKTVQATLLVDSLQKSVKVTDAETVVELKGP